MDNESIIPTREDDRITNLWTMNHPTKHQTETTMNHPTTTPLRTLAKDDDREALSDERDEREPVAVVEAHLSVLFEEVSVLAARIDHTRDTRALVLEERESRQRKEGRGRAFIWWDAGQ